RPIRSSLCDGSAPLDVARAFRSHFGFDDFYVADLDAIAGGLPSSAIPSFLMNGLSLWVDAGAHSARLRAFCGQWTLASLGIVMGLETLTGPDALADILGYGPEHVLFSLDLRNGEPLGTLSGWKHPSARGVAAEAISMGVERLLVLDLAR